MSSGFVSGAVKALPRHLGRESFQLLSDLARLFVCMQWAKQDREFIGRRKDSNVHFVVDADVAFNWAAPDEERSMNKLFDNKTVGITLSDVVGDWLFLPTQADVPPTRMYQGHAKEIDNKVGPQRAEILHRISEEVSKLTSRDRPLTAVELRELEDFVNKARELVDRSEVEELSFRSDAKRPVATLKEKLLRVLTSSRVKPMSRQWIENVSGPSNTENTDASILFARWDKVLDRPQARNELSHNADVGALSYVGSLDPQATKRGSRVVFLTGSSRIYRAWMELPDRPTNPEQIYLRHPLCFLFTSYSTQSNELASAIDGTLWTGYGKVFESLLQQFDTQLPDDPEALFDAAFYLAWTASHNHHGDGKAPSNERELSAVHWLGEELNRRKKEIGQWLATAQAFTLRAREAAARQIEASALANDSAPAQEEVLRTTPEFQLLTRLRYLEAKGVDALLEQLVSGVLAATLPAFKGAKSQEPPWRRVPILVFSEGDTEIQAFSIMLRTEPNSDALSAEKLNRARTIARGQQSRYLALVLDSLILAAFGEWAAAASMGRRAIERAEFFQKGSGTREALKQSQLSNDGATYRHQLFLDTKDVDGREARYMCAQAIRRSAQSLKDFEEADRHLRVFRAIVNREAREDPIGPMRAESESLALELAQWSYLAYQRGRNSVGQLLALTRRLEDIYIRLEEKPALTKRAVDPVSSAVRRYVWEQCTLNLTICLIELKIAKHPLDDRNVPPASVPPTLAEWVLAPNTESSRFSQFVTAVAYIVFLPRDALSNASLSMDKLSERIDSYTKDVPPDSVSFERYRAKAYRDLVDDFRRKDLGGINDA